MEQNLRSRNKDDNIWSDTTSWAEKLIVQNFKIVPWNYN